MNKVTTLDTIRSQIAQYIREDYPLFVEFLEAYHEWLNSDGQSHNAIRTHLDKFDLDESLDGYLSFLQSEFLKNAPEEVLIDKELFIKWSRKFNLSRGSHASYKFLFKVLFNEQDTEIYLPKENILRSSDGVYVSGESTILVTNTGDLDKFEFQQIFQKRQIYQDIFEYAYADVVRVKTRYSERYNILELVVKNVEGEFKEGFPVETEIGGFEWPITSVKSFTINDGGSGFTQSQRLTLDDFDTFDVERVADVDSEFDVRITSFLTSSDIKLYINNVEISTFSFDGRIISSTDIDIGDTVRVEMPSYGGYIVVDEVDEAGSVIAINITDYVIGSKDNMSLVWSNGGSGLDVTVNTGIVTPIKPYWEDNKGFLSSNMYLLDSFYYQDYSYLLRTQQSLQNYKDVVMSVLHPAGFQMFSELNILLFIDLILSVVSDDIDFETIENNIDILSKYGIGSNFSFFNKFKAGLTKRLYRMSDFDVYDNFMQHVYGESGYDLESDKLAIFSDYQYQSKIGWMSSSVFTELNAYKRQEYVEEKDSGSKYFESGYVRRTPIPVDFISFTDEEFLL